MLGVFKPWPPSLTSRVCVCVSGGGCSDCCHGNHLRAGVAHALRQLRGFSAASGPMLSRTHGEPGTWRWGSPGPPGRELASLRPVWAARPEAPARPSRGFLPHREPSGARGGRPSGPGCPPPRPDWDSCPHRTLPGGALAPSASGGQCTSWLLVYFE